MPNSNVPKRICPQKMVLVTRPPRGNWAWEVKYDGYRMMARLEDGAVTLITKNGHDWTRRFPNLRRELKKIPFNGYFDGEIIVQDDAGRPDFQALTTSVASQRTDSVVLVLFDVLHLESHDLRNEPLERRRELLKQVMDVCDLERVRFSDTFDEHPESLLESACQMKLEGLVGKKKGSAYTSSRNGDWIKLKCNNRQEFVIGGYTRSSTGFGLGALLLGYYDLTGHLQYAGRVGSGIGDKTARELSTKLRPTIVEQCPFLKAPRAGDSANVWVSPSLVCEVKFAEITPTGKIRHGVFIGMRSDITPDDVTLEISK